MACNFPSIAQTATTIKCYTVIQILKDILISGESLKLNVQNLNSDMGFLKNGKESGASVTSVMYRTAREYKLDSVQVNWI